MILNVKQVQSNLKNKFAILEDDEVKYLAGTPWLALDLPFDADKVRSCILTDTQENLIYSTSYNIGKNLVEGAIPMKWAFTGEQKSTIYEIYQGNNKCGSFYQVINGLMDTKYVIEYGNFMFKCYDIGMGKTRNIVIYDEEKQIAEVVKTLATKDNLDEYYLFLLDEYKDLASIFSFFIIFFDYQNYANSGEIVAEKEIVSVRYTFDKNNKFYNKDWIINNFNADKVKKIYDEMKLKRTNMSNDIKDKMKITLIFILLVWLVILVVFFIIWFLIK